MKNTIYQQFQMDVTETALSTLGNCQRQHDQSHPHPLDTKKVRSAGILLVAFGGAGPLHACDIADEPANWWASPTTEFTGTNRKKSA